MAYSRAHYSRGDPRGRPARSGLIAFALLLIGMLIFGFSFYIGGNHHSGSGNTASSHSSQAHNASAGNGQSTTPAKGVYPVVARVYNGSSHDLLVNVTSTIIITHVRQANGQISGIFSGQNRQASFTGVLDTSRHIFFTVSGQPPLFFQGSVRSDGILVGNYCTTDAAGQCVGNYGVWTLSPVP